MKIKMKSGIATISLLVVISSALLLMLVFNDSLLHLARENVLQRYQYLKTDFALPPISQEHCQKIPKPAMKNAARLQEFAVNPNDEGLQYFGYCQYFQLFKTGLNCQSTSIYDVDPQQLAHFQEKLARHANVFWFENDKLWQLERDITGIIIAQGMLEIQGNAKINGIILSAKKGNISLSSEISLFCEEQKLQKIIEDFQGWELVEKSWHDIKKAVANR